MTIGIGNEWDPGDPPEIHYERKVRKMASRLGLGRIIEWMKNSDLEELTFVLTRGQAIYRERAARVDRADSHGKVKRTRRTKAEMAAAAGKVASVAAVRGEADEGRAISA